MTRKETWRRKTPFERARVAISKRGDFLIQDYPDEIIGKYRGGASLTELAQEYFPEDFEISPNITKNAVLYALYKLLGEEEKRELGLAHKREAYKKKGSYKGERVKNPGRVEAGRHSYKTALSRIPPEELARICLRNMAQKGIFPYDSEVRFVSTGLNGEQLLYPFNEKDYILYLRDFGRMTWSQIETRVNEEFAASGKRPRTSNSLRVNYQNWQKESNQ
jgi:hypothetical protein